MSAYNVDAFSPPAPVAFVSFTNPDNSALVDEVMMLLDTGADISVIPENVRARLEVSASEASYEVELVDGETHILESVNLHMKWSRYAFRGKFLVTRMSYGIIGRNILNELRILLDGPKQEWDFK